MSMLPVNVDATYADDPTRPGRKQHQLHHDALHGFYNVFLGKTPSSFVDSSPAVLVFDGDSMTDPAETLYPTFAKGGINPRSSVYNFAVAGATLVTMQADAATQIDTLIDPTKRNVLVVMAGTNDLYLGETAATVQTRLQTYTAARLSAGWTVILMTIPPRSYVGDPGDLMTRLNAVNTWIRANAATLCDVLIDVEDEDRLSDSTDLTYYTDGLHLTHAGARVLADLVQEALWLEAGPVHSHDGEFLTWGVGQAHEASSVALGTHALENASANQQNNIAVGFDALRSATTALSNIGIGWEALNSLLTANSNVAVGSQVLKSATGSRNTGMGAQALLSTTTGENNVAAGVDALRGNTGGHHNVALGVAALYSNAGGNYNVAIGSSSLLTSTGSNNVGVGMSSLQSNTTGGNNVAVGHSALFSNTTSSNNVAVGLNAAYSLTGSESVAIGTNAMFYPSASTTATRGTAVGYGAGLASSTQFDDIVAVGHTAVAGAASATAVGKGAQALHTNSVAVGSGSATTAADQFNIGDRQLVVGRSLFVMDTIGVRTANNAIGQIVFYTDVFGVGAVLQAPGGANVSLGGGFPALTTGQYNTSLGQSAGGAVTAGYLNTAVGHNSLAANTLGFHNTAIGANTLTSLAGDPGALPGTSATNNTAVGANAGNALTTGHRNVAVGVDALWVETTGTVNVAIGVHAADHQVGVDGTVAVGYFALSANVAGTDNTGVGRQALGATTVSGGTGVGAYAGGAVTTGVFATAIGNQAMYSPNTDFANRTTTGSYQTAVGAFSGQKTATQQVYATALGYSALYGGTGAVALGAHAEANHDYSVALGMQSVSSASNQVQIKDRHIEGAEIADPAAPATNSGRVYFRDNGSGKTQFVVRFATGAVQVIATEP